MKRHISEKKLLEYINIILYIIFVITYLITLETFGMGDNNSRIRYYILAICVIVALFTIFKKYGFKLWKRRLKSVKLLLTIFTAIVFFVISLIKSAEADCSLNFRTVTQISLFLLPSIYVFCLVNIFDQKTIVNILKITTIILIITYFCEDTHNPFEFFKIDNWKKVSFSKSTSFTESNICSEAFLQLFLFFYYYYLKASEEKLPIKSNLRVCSIICFVFTLLSFKRLGMLFAISIFILGQLLKFIKFINFDKKMPKMTPVILSILFMVLTVLYTEIMRGTILQNLDIFTLTSGRDYILSLWEKKNYLTYGYGSSLLVIGRYLEMDLIQIYLELNAFALFLFCYTFFKNSSNKIYSVLIILYTFLNLLTASSLPYSLSWILLLINVSCIEDEKCKIQNLLIIPIRIKRKVEKLNVINENNKKN